MRTVYLGADKDCLLGVYFGADEDFFHWEQMRTVCSGEDEDWLLGERMRTGYFGEDEDMFAVHVSQEVLS